MSDAIRYPLVLPGAGLYAVKISRRAGPPAPGGSRARHLHPDHETTRPDHETTKELPW
ncbi:hypothetical protein [Streptomyces lydicus]|uniref:hypothetical protein n=1 Tax=Streptomyces lydicus TaxID=47763 RepID=UPI0036C157D7